MEKERYHNIDLLRIILINAIVIHHLQHAVTGVWNSGGYAVEFFFIISGFVFNLNYPKDKGTVEFISGKMIAFMPLLICTSTVLSIFTGFSLQKFFADLFFLQKTGLYTMNSGFSYNGPAWFVAILLWVLLFLFYLRKISSEQITNLVVGVLAFFALIILANRGKVPYDNTQIIRGFAAVSVGYFCAEFCKTLPRPTDNKKSILLTVLEAGILGYLTYILFSSYKVKNIVAIIFLMAILTILFYARKGYVSSWLNKKPFTAISVYVLPIFMTHALWYYPTPIFNYFNKLLGNLAAITAFGILASWITGIVGYHCIQVPCKKYLTKRLNCKK